MLPDHINSLQWHQAIGVARQSCAGFFRDGLSPRDAVTAYGIGSDAEAVPDWSAAVDTIAQFICGIKLKRAA